MHTTTHTHRVVHVSRSAFMLWTGKFKHTHAQLTCVHTHTHARTNTLGLLGDEG